MKTPFKVLVPAFLSGLIAAPASASGFYAGAEIGASTVPNLKDSVAQTMINSGYTAATASQNSSDGQAGIFGGQWLTDNFGWEANLSSLGSIRGKVAFANGTTLYTRHYRYSTAALSLAALGGIDVGATGKIFIKAGVYDAGVTFDGPTSTVSRNSAGPVIGGGFTMSVYKRFIARVELDNYVGVKFPAYEFFAQSGQIRKTNITTLSLGIAYGF
jgi:OmpA-like transmembrane domain